MPRSSSDGVVVDEESIVADDWVVARSTSGVVGRYRESLSITVVRVIAAASGDGSISLNSGAVIIESESTTDGLGDTSESGDALVSDSRGERSTASVAFGCRSDVEVVVGSDHSNPAGQWSSTWVLGWVFGGIDTSRVGTAASSDRGFKWMASVGDIQSCADRGWVTREDSGQVGSSLVSAVDGDRHTVSLTSLP